MTREELMGNGWAQKSVKIGTLFYKNGYFINLVGNNAVVYHYTDDTNHIGEAESMDGVTYITKEHDKMLINNMEIVLSAMIKQYEENYGEKYNG